MLTSSWPLMTSALTWSNGSTSRWGPRVSGTGSLTSGPRMSGPLKEKEKGKGERLNELKGKAGRLQKPNYSARLGPDGSSATWAAGLAAPQAGSARRAGFIFGLGRRTGHGALAAHSSFSSFFFSFPSFVSPMDRRTGPKGGGSEASPATRLDEVGRDGGARFFLIEQSGLTAVRPPAVTVTATATGAKAEQRWGVAMGGA